MNTNNQNKKPLLPRNCIDVDGKVIYSEGNQAWNIIKLKKEVLNEFYQLKDKSSKLFSYKMVYYRKYEELEKAIRELKKNNQALPVLVWLYKDESSEH